MPFLNRNGEWCAGVGGGIASWGTASGVGTTVWTPAGGTCWLDNDNVVAQHCTDICRVKKGNIRTVTEVVVAPRGANYVTAGGGVWAAWLAGYGVYSSTGLLLPIAGLGPAGPDGAIAVKRSYQSAGPWDVYETDGTKWLLTSGDAGGIQLLGQKRAFWTEGGEPMVTEGIPKPNPKGRPFWWLRMLQTPSGWWCLYQESAGGSLVMHPVTSTQGYVIATGQDTFAPDFMMIGTNKIRVVWSVTEGQPPQDIRVKDIDLSDARTEVGGTPSLDPGTGGTSPGQTTILPLVPGSISMTSVGTFGMAGLSVEIPPFPEEVFPTFPVPIGPGFLLHPTLGRAQYEVKPDEWMNIDADAIVPPVWSSSRTLNSAANVLWPGHLRDVVVEERWKSLGGLAMPIEQLRLLVAIWTTPVDPEDGYVEWHPDYLTGVSFKVLLTGLTVGGQGVTLNDVVNYKDQRGEDGWVTDPVILTMRLVERL